MSDAEASGQDIAERKRIGDSLRESEEKLRGLYELSPLGIALTDMNGRFVEFNEAFRRITGYPESELKALDYWALTPAKYQADEARQLESLASTGRYGPYEKEYQRKDGSLVPLRLNGVLTAGRDGRKFIWSIVEDITESRRAADDLRDSHVFMQGILNSVSSQIAVLDKAGAIMAVNESWRRFSLENSLEPGKPAPNSGVGANYLKVCDDASSAPEECVAAREGIQAVLDGRLPAFGLEYPCHAPHLRRWFTMTVTPLGSDGRGAVVVHNDITARKQAEEQIRSFAYLDSLTQLPNRRMLQDRLALAIAGSKRSDLYGALLLLDLDNFKPLNDEYGHAVGDLLLIEVAKRLTRCVREVDTVARLGGDEFVVVLSGLNADRGLSREQALVIAEKIRAALAQPYLLTLRQESGAESVIEHRCSSSIGVVLFVGDQTSQTELIKCADTAMYRAKGAGRNAVRFNDSNS